MSTAQVGKVMDVLESITNGVAAQAYANHISELMLWMLLQQECEKNIARLDTNYE